MLIIVIVILAILIIGWYISTNNALVKKRTLAEEAYSTMDIYLKKRYDLIPNLVNTVKGYMSHEEDTLKEVVNLRNSAIGADVNENVKMQNEISTCLSKIVALAENYPELKADTQFLNLQSQLSAIETDIAQARKYYNGAVRELNTQIRVFPAKIVASMNGFEEMPYYEAAESERENVKVEF